jgi:hypothetical protein
VETWVRTCASFEEEREADRQFWARLTPDERVAAVESLRQQWLKMTGQRDERLRRTVRVLDGPER